MSNNKYIETVEYGNLYINIIPKLIPLVLWSYFIYKYYYPYYRASSKYSFIFILILCIPFIIVLQEILLNKNLLFTTKAAIPNLWNRCFTPSKDSQDLNIIGVYDYQCGAHQTHFNQDVASLLQNKFYYLNFALFLLILVYHKLTITSQKTLKNAHIVFISIALFCGTLGVLPCSYTVGYTWSLMSGMMFSTILNMNISAFLIILYALYRNII